jgi:hypothetical protein
MTAAEPISTSWERDTQRCTTLLLQRVAAFLTDGPEADVAELDRERDQLEAGTTPPPALATIRDAFGLSAFECDVLGLCARVELDPQVARQLGTGADGAGTASAAPTFGFALATLPDPHWSALTPQAPLRRWGIVELGVGRQLTTRPLALTERVLHALTGVRYLDEDTGLRAPQVVPELTAGQARIVDAAALALTTAAGGVLPVVQVLSRSRGTALGAASAVAARVGLGLAVTRAEDLPGDGPHRAAPARRLELEAVLARVLVVVDALDAEGEVERAAARLVDELAAPVVVLARRPLPVWRSDVRLTVPAAAVSERLATWTQALGPATAQLDGQITRVAELFDLDPMAIRATAAEYAAHAAAGRPDRPAAGDLFWTLVRDRARPRLEHLTDRVRPAATWATLVLPPAQLDLVRDLAAQVRSRFTVHGDWGFDTGGGRGAGISALFSGPSGTGKTMTAEVIANDLGLDLYRIDLSRVVSKYIGETEKNLGNVFDEAEGAGAILLFDEADALFGRRSEVRDSHDRYANLEVSYLLQRMESYDGLAVLTTNQREALDPAFLRRLRFAVTFPFPDPAARAQIWRRVFPPTVPTEGLDHERLGQLNVAGGTIRTMALTAAFYAAAESVPVQMRHLMRAARAEFAKLDRPLPEAQVRGWT